MNLSDFVTGSSSMQRLDRLFFDTRRALTEALRVDVVACVHLVQRLVSDALLANNVHDEFVRMAKCDLAETLLLKAARALAESSPEFQALNSPWHREQWLTAYLTPVMLEWLSTKVRSVDDVRSLGRARRLLSPPSA